MDDKIGRYFGLVIGIVIPGFVGMYAVSFFVPPVAVWLGVVASQDTSVGGFLFALLASIGMGLFIGGLRAFVMDRQFVTRPSLDVSKRNSEPVEAAYGNIKADHYPYYQFYSGMVFALGFLYLSWLSTWPSTTRVVVVTLLLAAAEGILYWSAVDAMERYQRKREKLLGLVPPQSRTA
jgi:hypothetical protein